MDRLQILRLGVYARKPAATLFTWGDLPGKKCPFQIAEMYTDVTSEIICAEEYQLVYDYNDDCRIGIDDFATIAEAWMNCNEVPTCLDQHMPFIIE